MIAASLATNPLAPNPLIRVAFSGSVPPPGNPGGFSATPSFFSSVLIHLSLLFVLSLLKTYKK